MTLFAVVVGVFCGLILLASLLAIWFQRRTFAVWIPVAAVIVEQTTKRESNLLEDAGLENLIGAASAERLSELAGSLGKKDGVSNAELLKKNVREVSYRYFHAGKKFTSSSISLRHSDSSNDFFDRFPIGRTVTAYVDPKNPSRSYLVPTPLFRGYGGALFAVWILSLLVIVDTNGFVSEDPASWFFYVAAWWLLGIVAIVHFASLRGPFSASAVAIAGLYFTLTSLPYSIPLAKTNLLPGLSATLGLSLPSAVTDDIGLYVVGGVAALVCILFVVLVLWVLISMFRVAYRFHHSFQPVMGRVIVSEMRKESSGGGGGGESSSRYWYYWPEIQFEYDVDGSTFDTGVYAPSNALAGSSKQDADKIRRVLERYPVGSDHEARYDPEQPHVAYLAAQTVGGHVNSALKLLAWLMVAVVVIALVPVLFAAPSN